MKVQKIPEGLDVVLQVSRKLEVVLSKHFNYDTEKIPMSKHLANLYMRKHGISYESKGNGKYSYIKCENYKDNGKRFYLFEGDNYSGYVSDEEYIDDIFSYFTVAELFDQFIFITAEDLVNGVCLNKYQISVIDDNLSIEQIDKFYLKNVEGSVAPFKDGNILTLDESKSFFEDIDSGMNLFIKSMRRLIFNTFSYEKGFMDIQTTLRDDILNNYNPVVFKNNFELFEYWYWMGQKEYFYLIEKLIKTDRLNECKKYNPVVSKKPIPDISEVRTLTGVSLQIFKKYFRNDPEEMENFLELEKLITPNGMVLIDEMLTYYNKIESAYGTGFYCVNWRVFQYLKVVFEKFDVRPKVLIDRIIRASFYENISPNDYLEIIIDYETMSEKLGLKVDRKIPKNVIHLHDVLMKQILYIRNQEIEEMFEKVASQNNLLLKHLPENEHLTVISPKDPCDLIDEGFKMNHCVGSYIDRYALGYSKIFFVRRKTLIDQSFVTIELTANNTLVQAKSYSNKSPDKTTLDFINGWIKNIKEAM